MRLVSSLISQPLDVRDGVVTSVVVENGVLFRRFVEDLQESIEHGCSEIVLSDEGKDLQPSKRMELISSFVPFSLNQKGLLSALTKRLEHNAQSAAHVEATHELIKRIREYLRPLLLDFSHEIEPAGLTIGTLLKSTGCVFVEDDVPLVDKLVGYFRLVRELDAEKLFVLVNLRAYLSDLEAQGFLEQVLSEKFGILLVEASARTLCDAENRLIIDDDLCEIAAGGDDDIPPHDPLRKC